MIRISHATPTDTLISALEEVETAKSVVIMLEREADYILIANCVPDEIKSIAANAIVICNLKSENDSDA